MSEKESGLWVAAIVSVIILAAIVIWAVVKQQAAETTPLNHNHDHSHQHDERSFEPLSEGTDKANHQKMSLRDVIDSARTWGPAYTSWYGRTAPDFTLVDITGKQHKLSDYRGKDVMIIFWATWCRPCIVEMPHLIALRNIISEDKLAMLAISNENPALVKNFVNQKNINYTVLLDQRTMPMPYSQVRSIPCSFFIDPEGKIKLATEGLLSLGEMKAIVQAEPQTQ